MFREKIHIVKNYRGADCWEADSRRVGRDSPAAGRRPVGGDPRPEAHGSSVKFGGRPGASSLLRMVYRTVLVVGWCTYVRGIQYNAYGRGVGTIASVQYLRPLGWNKLSR